MNSTWISALRGYVKIAVYGNKIESFINELMHANIDIWNISKISDGMELYVHVNDFFRLRKHLKKTGCRMHVIQRYGFPFLLERVEKRKVFVFGFISFIAAIYILSSFIWQVEVQVDGENITEQFVVEVAKEIGIQKFQWKFRLEDPDVLSKQLLARLPDTSWVGIEVVGTRVNIHVIEAVKPEDMPLLNPRHLVSDTDAVITQIVAERGKPMVHIHSHVKKGDILISGFIGNEENQVIVAAKGTVKGLVWHEYVVTVPLRSTSKGLTGESITRYYVLVGDRAVRISGFVEIPYDYYESDIDVKQMEWRNWRFPVSIMLETIHEVKMEQQIWNTEQAKHIGLEQAKLHIERVYGPEAIVKAVNVLEMKQENDHLTIKVMFEVERDITEEKPIISDEMTRS